jgi:ribonuclease E
VLKASNGSWINEFEEQDGKNILIKSEPTLHPEQFDIQG